ncbi:hypothetical protein CBER1_05187 [Cercospora berteroae]|uniref:Uncharacterized protein n=1 Tax=Cercospora berteroae TaxID=357750 RepID=A0A2S6BRS7_9PEZI|nr:hypothetical protein CBER1_05187 [Cercospora berteroae]
MSNVSGSLQDSAGTPGKLAWVCLLNDSDGPANPRWDSDKIIVCKRNQVPIAVFKQIPRTGKSDRVFSFIDYHTISHLEFLEPRSDALVRMLDQKWSYVDKFGEIRQKERTIESWNEALCKKWAVVKFKELDEKKFQPPRIERLPDPEPKRAPKKSVNEMSKEMRMSGEDRKEAKEGNVR